MRCGTRAIKAVAFTGSTRGGRALFDLAAARPDPIPFYGELGSTNPVVITPQGWAHRADEIAAGFAGSVTLGSGSSARNPGSSSYPIDDYLARVPDLSAGPLLNEHIDRGYLHSVEEMARCAPAGRGTVPSGAADPMHVPHAPHRSQLAPRASRTRDVRSRSPNRWLFRSRRGPGPRRPVTRPTTATVHGADTPDAEESELMPARRARRTRVVERLADRRVRDRCPAPRRSLPGHHVPTVHSVGTAAVQRFLRPVTFQNVPQAALPPELRDAPTEATGKKVHHDLVPTQLLPSPLAQPADGPGHRPRSRAHFRAGFAGSPKPSPSSNPPSCCTSDPTTCEPWPASRPASPSSNPPPGTATGALPTRHTGSPRTGGRARGTPRRVRHRHRPGARTSASTTASGNRLNDLFGSLSAVPLIPIVINCVDRPHPHGSPHRRTGQGGRPVPPNPIPPINASSSSARAASRTLPRRWSPGPRPLRGAAPEADHRQHRPGCRSDQPRVGRQFLPTLAVRTGHGLADLTAEDLPRRHRRCRGTYLDRGRLHRRHPAPDRGLRTCHRMDHRDGHRRQHVSDKPLIRRCGAGVTGGHQQPHGTGRPTRISSG